MCTVCRHQLPLTDYSFNEENRVDRIFYGRINIAKASSFLFYSEKGIVKNLIHNLKYKGQEQIGTFLGEWYGELIKEQGFPMPIDYVIPVPLHRKKLRKRGFNQTVQFSKKLAFYLQAEYLDNVLVKTANTRTQTKKNRMGRWFDNKSLYELRQPEKLEYKNILLVDDVITTGATMELCSQAFKDVKGISIYIASMAVVP